MQPELSLRERFLLESWLPKESEAGAEQTDARSLLTSDQTLTPSEVRDRLEKLRKCRKDLETERSVLEFRPAVGRGFSSRQPGDVVLTWISPWEEAWLIVDQLRSQGRLAKGAAAARELPAKLGESLLNAVAIAVLCLDTEAEAQRLAKDIAADAKLSAADGPWLRWLAGDKVDLASLPLDELVGETPKKALAAAMEGHWAAAEGLLPKPLKKAFAKALQPSGSRMEGQFLAQLSAHVLRNAPPRAVVDASLSALFGFYGFDKNAPWWNGREVHTRLPLVALYARALEPEKSGAAVLHALRSANPHLVEPPPRTFVGPAEVVAAIAKLERVLADAVKSRKGLEVSLGEEGSAYRVA